MTFGLIIMGEGIVILLLLVWREMKSHSDNGCILRGDKVKSLSSVRGNSDGLADSGGSKLNMMTP